MNLDHLISVAALTLLGIVFLAVGKWLFNLLHPRFDLSKELVKHDNFAMALTIGGYFLGLVIALGGVLSGESRGLVDDVLDFAFYSVIALVLLNISGWINDKLMLHEFDNDKEIVEDQNPGTGAVQGANYVANGLILFGAMSGQGDLITALAFWALGQVALLLVTRVYDLIVPYKLHDQIEKDNVAVGVAFAGVLVGFGNLIRFATMGDFISWQVNFVNFAWTMGFGLLLLPLLRVVVDKVFLPGESLTDELVNQEKPNVGAGLIEAITYIAVSFLAGWIV